MHRCTDTMCSTQANLMGCSFSSSNLQPNNVTRMTTTASLMHVYTSPAWWDFTSAHDRNRMEKFLRRLWGRIPPHGRPSADFLARVAEQRLFNSVATTSTMSWGNYSRKLCKLDTIYIPGPMNLSSPEGWSNFLSLVSFLEAYSNIILTYKVINKTEIIVYIIHDVQAISYNGLARRYLNTQPIDTLFFTCNYPKLRLWHLGYLYSWQLAKLIDWFWRHSSMKLIDSTI